MDVGHANGHLSAVSQWGHTVEGHLDAAARFEAALRAAGIGWTTRQHFTVRSDNGPVSVTASVDGPRTLHLRIVR